MLQSSEDGVIMMLVAGTIMLLLLGIFIIGFLFFYQKRHNANITEQETLKANFKQEILKAQLEIREQTLTDISRELHDNVNQVLSFVKLNLRLAETSKGVERELKIKESHDLVAQSITDLRNLSRSMSYDHIAAFGLVRTLESECDRVNRSGLITINFSVSGSPYPLDEQRELVLFRIFQEALNNTLKYAGAKCLQVTLQYSAGLFNLTLKDDGIGFLPSSVVNKGAGLKNITSRAALIGAMATIDSEPGKGCLIRIILDPYTNQTDGPPHTNSPG
jgi:signal transduction histidine kinase